MIRFPITAFDVRVKVEVGDHARINYKDRKTYVSLHDNGRWFTQLYAASEVPFDAVLNAVLELTPPFNFGVRDQLNNLLTTARKHT